MSLYSVVTSSSYLKKIIALAIMQNGIWLFFISMTYRDGIVANPLPHVLMLTAIVVGAATLAIAVSLMIGIKNERE